MSMPKEYIGDAVYVRHDGRSLILTTEDGLRATNEIYLEPVVWLMLEQYVERVKKAIEAERVKKAIAAAKEGTT